MTGAYRTELRRQRLEATVYWLLLLLPLVAIAVDTWRRLVKQSGDDE